jgi:antitoxin ParD1/3/4
MAHNTSVSLGDHLMQFVNDCVRSGRYSSASDAVRAGLRLLEAEEAKLEALRAALVDGEKSGKAEPFDFDAFIDSRKR